MDIIRNFIAEYGTQILYTLLTAIAGYLGVMAKKLYTQYVNDKTKEKIARTVVQAVEQIYKDLHGEEKLNKALESASEMLSEKGITVTDLELRMLIESTLAEFNGAFNSASPVNETAITETAEDMSQPFVSKQITGFAPSNAE